MFTVPIDPVVICNDGLVQATASFLSCGCNEGEAEEIKDTFVLLQDMARFM